MVVINWMPEDLVQFYERTTPQTQQRAHQDFLETYLPVTARCETDKDIALVIREEGIGAVVIGSDALFSYIPKMKRLNKRKLRFIQVPSNLNFPNPFWGGFKFQVPGLKIAGMSISAQNTPYKWILSPKLKREMARYLHNFDYLSVRDVWTQKMIRYLTRGKLSTNITPDPVFAFNENITDRPYLSRQEVLSKYQLPDNYLLFSLDSPMLTQEYVKSFEEECAKHGFFCVGFPKTNAEASDKFSRRVNLPLSPMDWYYLIKYSRGYVGELMHPIIVALHNAVPLFSFDKYGFKNVFGKVDNSSSKIYHILSSFGLLSNYYSIVRHACLPEVSYVINALKTFDVSVCRRIAQSKYEEYLKMMEKITNLI